MSRVRESKPYLLRQRCLGSEAIYAVAGEHDGIVTAEVIRAPGLERGTHVRLLARAARQMDRLDLSREPLSLVAPGFTPPLAA